MSTKQAVIDIVGTFCPWASWAPGKGYSGNSGHTLGTGVKGGTHQQIFPFQSSGSIKIFSKVGFVDSPVLSSTLSLLVRIHTSGQVWTQTCIRLLRGSSVLGS